MIACLDVYYSETKGRAAAVVFQDWSSTAAVTEYETTIEEIVPYQPGQFYLRELQPLIAVIKKIAEPIETYVIDGYCHLSPDFAPGLGVHLHEFLGDNSVIIGVAKNRYQQSEHAYELRRGQSNRPLFVTAIGIDYQTAAEHIRSMVGTFRIPTLIKAADTLSRMAMESNDTMDELRLNPLPKLSE